MSRILFLAVPSHGHVNPTVGLVHELVRRGERVTYFAAEPFRERIEGAGATFRAYAHDLDIFKGPPLPGQPSALLDVVGRASEVVGDVLAQTAGERFDLLLHSTPFPFARPLGERLGLPRVSSLAVFLGIEPFLRPERDATTGPFAALPGMRATLARASGDLQAAHGVRLPATLREMLHNPGLLNLVYTSRYFAGYPPYFDDSYCFVGAPVHDRQERVDFPLQQLAGRRVLYISLGTVFAGRAPGLHARFFAAFADWDGVVVLAAHGVDLAGAPVPANFIVRGYVPQTAVLRYASVAITHGGMNSMSDLLAARVPFVCLPLGADQPALAARACELGATLVLDAAGASPAELRAAVDRVDGEPRFREGIARIADSFAAAGGYPKAVDEIFALQRRLGIR